MSLTEPVGAAAAVLGQTTTGEKGAVNKDDFLTLLMAQLQYQDPLNPMEGTEFTSQLAQFSSLEQLTTINENLECLQLYQASLNNAQAVDFIGKTVRALGDAVAVTDGIAPDLQFDLAGDAAQVYVSIYDSGNHLVKTIPCGALTEGLQRIEWDGTNGAGDQVADGMYRLEVAAEDANGNAVTASNLVEAEIDGITFEEGSTYLISGELRIAMGDVIAVKQESKD